MWRRILVPHDFSPCADRALAVAVELARVHRAELLLAHVSTLPSNLPPHVIITPPGRTDPMRVDDYVLGEARAKLEAIRAPLEAAGSPPSASMAVVCALGSVAEEILQVADALRADLLVVGTHGRTGLGRWLIGSVAEKLVRLAPIPVLTVRGSSVEAAPTIGEEAAVDETTG